MSYDVTYVTIFVYNVINKGGKYDDLAYHTSHSKGKDPWKSLLEGKKDDKESCDI